MRNQQDFFSGLLFIAVGSAFAWGAGEYDIGTASYMGPGYYPRLLGILSILVGTAVVAKTFIVKSDEDGRIGTMGVAAAHPHPQRESRVRRHDRRASLD